MNYAIIIMGIILIIGLVFFSLLLYDIKKHGGVYK